MALEIDYIAHNNNLKDVESKIKIAISGLLLLVALIANIPIVSILIFFIAAIFLLAIAKIPVRFYLKFISIPLSFAVITTVFMIFFFGTGTILWDTGIWGVVVREDALNLGITTFLRVMACFSALGILSMTTPVNEILHFSAKLKIPKVFLEIAMLMYTTIFIFLDQFEAMSNAQKTRLGYNGLKNTYRSLGLLMSNLFFKSLDKGEKLQNSLDSRCYSGEFPVYKK
ncbi:cobalt transport protein CbiQ [Methanobrevibacter cuticularis]|uniref:Cobalt transport protein CbiQ n=1 Tax=Methanobrevibacter cuticularis TaxID=47311 RepID=A0A166CGH5_9EURY|nr:cobalt ECF transporter T component CbiQ [Methanobrevibacter cuticularis]KZX14484.1 cobalt transport protein CbiQ [Methanobrevibacter cuticularis]